jgi:hypothetical protein
MKNAYANLAIILMIHSNACKGKNKKMSGAGTGT